MASPSVPKGFHVFPVLVLLLLLASALSEAQLIPPSPAPSSSSSATLRLLDDEQQAAYLALEAASPETPWRYLYPDDLCLSGPHGLFCDLFPSNDPASNDVAIHVVEFNFGYLSGFSSNPPCGPNATIPTSLPFPFLRKLLFYNCFVAEGGPTLDAAFWRSLPPSLEELVFIRNPSLGGRLSGSIAALQRLRRLVISGSRITGAIPLETGGLRQLEQLVLSSNLLRGEIPGTVGRLGRLKVLDLSGNRLGGSIPIEIGRLRDLAMLDLSSNQLAGPVTIDFAGLRRLELLDLRSNRLTGGIPVALAEMASLKEVYLDDNELGGTIPEIWEKLGGLVGIGLSGAGLVGRIPASMGVFLQRLCYLALDNNQLEGELPEELKRLESSAREINLENNGLHGRVPFSAGFIGRMGGKLKLQGNPGLCLVDHAAGSLRWCNKSETPRAVVLFTSNGVASISVGNCYGLLLSLGFLILLL